jgi:pimeloyl-ACP methyl ester carboxylesterase
MRERLGWWPTMAPLSPREQQQIDQANASQRTPVVFVHGLWLLAGSWDNWAALFDEQRQDPAMRRRGDRHRGHSLTIDSGWRDVAETALQFVKRFV